MRQPDAAIQYLPLTSSRYAEPDWGAPRMDMMSMVTGILSMQQGNLQGQIATRLTKQNEDAEKFAVQTLLGAPSTANLASGVGGNLNVTA
jgi:hypothetical protein